MATDISRKSTPSTSINELQVIGNFGGAEVEYSKAKTILTRATGFMDEYDYTLNPYRGCSFGCTYCYAAFFSRNKEQVDNWGDWVIVKQNAVELLEKRKPGSLNGKRIYMSSVTDPYQPIERKLELTRRLLEILADQHAPKLMVQTRSQLVSRDIDLFQKIETNTNSLFESGESGRVQVNMTVTTDDRDIMRTFEPICPPNPKRLEAIAKVQEAGIESCITMTPLLLVKDFDGFAESLLDTGVRKFIAQPFHFKKGKFVAQTRTQAFELMAEKLNCGPEDFMDEYLEHYQAFVDVFTKKLQERDLPELGERKDGFKPPW